MGTWVGVEVGNDVGGITVAASSRDLRGTGVALAGISAAGAFVGSTGGALEAEFGCTTTDAVGGAVVGVAEG